MKKMYKRILALVLVLALTFSCTAFASAAETTAEAPDFVSEQSDGDEGIMPLAEDTISTGAGSTSTAGESRSLYLRFSTRYKPYIAINAGSACVIHVRLAKDGNTIGSATCNFTGPNQTIDVKLSSQNLAAGNYTITFIGDRNGVIYAWQLLGRS